MKLIPGISIPKEINATFLAHVHELRKTLPSLIIDDAARAIKRM